MTEAEYMEACQRIAAWMAWRASADAVAASKEDTAAMLSLVDDVCAYEEEHYPIGEPTPEEAEKFRREQEGEA